MQHPFNPYLLFLYANSNNTVLHKSSQSAECVVLIKIRIDTGLSEPGHLDNSLDHMSYVPSKEI